MNDIFYRKKQKRRKLYQRGRVVKAVIIFAFLSFALFGNRGVVQRVKLENEKREIIESIEAAEIEKEFLTRQLERISTDDAFIERIARERYGMIRSGERVYRIAEE